IAFPGISDGSEDFDLDGVVDSGEGDPEDPSDDAAAIDSDGDGLSDGLTFGEVCVQLCDHVDEAQAPLRAAGYLRHWIETGLVTGMRPS
ncbi:MAG: hypothetical protein L0271_18740, partial [Gemmatimonadetes bacterium]|nr:hypothetical protein [Gemmatimonadota bacterium]